MKRSLFLPQGPEHPNPGKPFTARGFPRHCYLPDSEKGRLVSLHTSINSLLPFFFRLTEQKNYICLDKSSFKCNSSGVEAVAGGMGPQADLLCGNLQHYWRDRHSHLEWSTSQDRVRLQPDWPRLPRLRPFGQRPGGAEGTRYHRRRLSEGLRECKRQWACVELRPSRFGSNWNRKSFL